MKILHDKEQLREETRSLKQTLNTLLKENARLQTLAQGNDKQLANKDNKIKELLDQLPHSHLQSQSQSHAGSRRQSKSGTHLGSILKQKAKEIRKENAALKQQLETLNHSVKLTALQERQADLKVYATECVRLRTLFADLASGKHPLAHHGQASSSSSGSGSHTRSALEERLGQQNQLLAKVKKEQEELLASVQQREEEARKWQAQLDSQNIQATTIATTNTQLQQTIRESAQEIQKLQETLKQAKIAERAEREVTLKSVLQELQNAKTALLSQLTEKEDVIRSLELKLVECKRSKDAELSSLLKMGQKGKPPGCSQC